MRNWLVLNIIAAVFSVLAWAQIPNMAPSEPDSSTQGTPDNSGGPANFGQNISDGNQSVSPPTGDMVRRDPFRGPQYLIDKIRAMNKPPSSPSFVNGPTSIDDSVEPLKRWPLNSYDLVGILWDVKNPKALVQDPQKKVHVIKLRDQISNDTAMVKSIREGSILVELKGATHILRIKKK